MIKIVKGTTAASLRDEMADTKQTATTDDQLITQQVREIIQQVQQKGDQALRAYTAKFDQLDLPAIEVSAAEIDAAVNQLDPTVWQALQKAAANIRSFHQLEKQTSFVDESIPGVKRGIKVTPLASVGIYVPGGTAAYPSSVLMNAIPAKIAGVPNVVMVTPPQKAGLNPAILAAAKLAGVDKIYQVGGPQAIAALAYGTETIPAVDKITGPGNAYVANAKKQVFGQVAIDMIAGPSEIGILADQGANPAQVAADLLSQAEHDVKARTILITDSESLANQVADQIEQQLAQLPRQEIAQAAIENNGVIYVVDNPDQMIKLMNDYAPEHLEVQLANPDRYLAQIQNAGSVFLGSYASEPLGDYLAGPNHILPTGGTARFSSALGVWDFQKHIQYLEYDQAALLADADAVIALAEVEGLSGHAQAIRIRKDQA